MIHRFYVFSNHDIGLGDLDFSSGNYTLSTEPRVLRVRDDDDVLDDENGQENDGSIGLLTEDESWDSSGQHLVGDIDGLNVAGNVVQSVYVFDVVNTTTGETGRAHMLRIYDTDQPGNVYSNMGQVGPYYYALTIPIKAGDTVIYSNPRYIGQVNYSDLQEGPPICFVAGTLIATPGGNQRVEALRPGDSVLTHSGAAARVQWVGIQRISAARQSMDPRLAPIRIAAGALGAGLPSRDLLVSQQHRILVTGRPPTGPGRREEALVPACQLFGLTGISREPSRQAVTYVHFLCDGHQLVLAEGTPAETLLPGPEALKSLSASARNELAALMPTALQGALPRPAAPILAGRRARDFARQYLHLPGLPPGRAAANAKPGIGPGPEAL